MILRYSDHHVRPVATLEEADLIVQIEPFCDPPWLCLFATTRLDADLDAFVDALAVFHQVKRVRAVKTPDFNVARSSWAKYEEGDFMPKTD